MEFQIDILFENSRSYENEPNDGNEAWIGLL